MAQLVCIAANTFCWRRAVAECPDMEDTMRRHMMRQSLMNGKHLFQLQVLAPDGYSRDEV